MTKSPYSSLFAPWSAVFEAPLSGDVFQKIEPNFENIEIAGVAEIERRVVREEASYGRQLGWLTEAVLRLAELHDLDHEKVDELAKLKTLDDRVREIKSEETEVLKRRAEEALAKLKLADETAWREVTEK